MKVHTIDDYAVLSVNCSHCKVSTGANINADKLYQEHRGHLEQVTVSLLTPSRGPNQSIVKIRVAPQPTPLAGAKLIEPNGRETGVYPMRPATGFSQEEIARLVGQQYEVFLLPGGSLLVIRPLAAGAEAGSSNTKATELLRLAPDDPGGEVHGDALLLHADEI